jgi:hypothetical protein
MYKAFLCSYCRSLGTQQGNCEKLLPKGVPQGQTESGGIVLAAIFWGPSAQRRCHPEETYLPTFSHLLIVNKLLSLSLYHRTKLLLKCELEKLDGYAALLAHAG